MLICRGVGERCRDVVMLLWDVDTNKMLGARVSAVIVLEVSGGTLVSAQKVRCIVERLWVVVWVF